MLVSRSVLRRLLLRCLGYILPKNAGLHQTKSVGQNRAQKPESNSLRGAALARSSTRVAVMKVAHIQLSERV